MSRSGRMEVESDVVRCQWPGIEDSAYARYHDEEWGVPQGDDRALFEKLMLEGFQAGLSWLTILRKRETFRLAFDGFEPEAIARYGARDIERLMADAGIVRNRAKIEATIGNARAYLQLRETTSLGALLWGIARADSAAPRTTLIEHADAVAQTPTSRAMSKILKAAGFRFVGPTTVYAFMQSVGMVNDHLASCHRHAPCARLQDAFTPPRS